MLDVRKLLLLREVDIHGSIAAAAQALNYTRSAVSQQLSALEAETGVQLLQRTNRRAELTETGRLLVAHSERVFAQLEEAESDLRAADGRVHGRLRVGIPFHEGPALLVTVLTGVRTRYPDLKITLCGVSATQSRRAVRAGTLDLALTARYDAVPEPVVPGLYEELVATDQIRLAVGSGHPLSASSSAQSPGRFTADPWIFDPETALGKLTLHLCATAGFEPESVADTGDMSATLGLVSSGWGVALVPDLVPDRPGYPVVRITLHGVPPTRQVFVVTRRGMLTSPAVSAVLEVIRERAAPAPLTG